MVKTNGKRIVKTTQKTIMGLPQLLVISILGGVIALVLGNLTGFIANLFTGVGDLGVTFISVVLALTVFSFAMGLGKFNIVKDLIPIFIVAPLVVAILFALNLGNIPVIDTAVQFGASLGMTVASLILANNVVKQFKLFK